MSNLVKLCCTGPFNWGKALCAGEKVNQGRTITRKSHKQHSHRTQGAARHGNQEPRPGFQLHKPRKEQQTTQRDLVYHGPRSKASNNSAILTPTLGGLSSMYVKRILLVCSRTFSEPRTFWTPKIIKACGTDTQFWLKMGVKNQGIKPGRFYWPPLCRACTGPLNCY